MRIAIFGAGGVGGYFGGRLVQAGENIVFIARGGNLEALRARGLKVDSIEGDFSLAQVQVADDPKQVGEVDAILFCVKAGQVSQAAPALRPMLGPRTCVVPLQNGVEAPAVLRTVLGREHVMGGLCSLIVSVIEPGQIRHTGGKPLIKFGELDNRRSERVMQLYRAFERAQGLSVEIPASIEAAIWQKFVFIAAWGGVGALTRAPVGILRKQPGTLRMLQQAIQEILAVARALGIELPEDVLESTRALLDEMPPEGTASMQRDIMCHRPSELEAQTGAVVRLGREAGVETPINTLIYESLLPQELRSRGRLHF